MHLLITKITQHMGFRSGEQILKQLINQSGKTINAIQEESGMKTGTLYRLLSGKHKDVTLTTAFKLADALSVDLNEFREEKEDESIN